LLPELNLLSADVRKILMYEQKFTHVPRFITEKEFFTPSPAPSLPEFYN
jgi:hypothetical protein